MQVRCLSQRQHHLEALEQAQEGLIELPQWQDGRLEAVCQLRISLDGAERVLGADTNYGKLQLVTQVLDDIEERALFIQIARKDVMDLVDNQHLQANVAKQFDRLELLLVYTIIRLVGREERIEDGVVEAPFVRDGRGLDDQYRNDDAIAAGIVGRRVLLAKTLHQHGFPIVGLADDQQVGHAVRLRVGQQVLELVEDGLGAGIADPARGSNAFNPLRVRQREQLGGHFVQVRSRVSHHSYHPCHRTAGCSAIQEPLPETLSSKLLAEHHLMPLTEALRNIHFPTNPDVLRRAQYRLKFEELFYVQLNILRYAKDRQKRYRGYIFERVGDVFNTFYSQNLPFQLTGAQKRVLKEIRNDVGSGRQMNRLLQGDVGSGKTLVALMSMLLALDNGFQACMMAPTEILANQHYETIKELLFGMDIRVELLTGSIKGKKREAILTGLLTGDVKILIGTHAVIEDTVNFSSLGLVVIDEQHRFGVAQRARLWTKNIQPPHVLVMTATPIPRTLQFSLMGARDLSVIQTPPPNRYPIQTEVHTFNEEVIVDAINFEMSRNGQVFLVNNSKEEEQAIKAMNGQEYVVQQCCSDQQVNIDPAVLSCYFYSAVRNIYCVAFIISMHFVKQLILCC